MICSREANDMKVRMMFVAIVAVMIAVGLLAIINMQKNPGGEREMTMNDENLQLSKECSRLLDASIKSNVPIVLDIIVNQVVADSLGDKVFHHLQDTLVEVFAVKHL